MNGVLLAARKPAEASSIEIPGSYRVVEARVRDLWIGGVYFPNNQPKVRFWRDEFMPLARDRVGRPYLFIGDFNTGKHYIDESGATFFGAEYMDQMEELGWTDAWRSVHPNGREYTWFSGHGNGFRVDHAWLSPALSARLKHAEHHHEAREAGITDHAALMVELG